MHGIENMDGPVGESHDLSSVVELSESDRSVERSVSYSASWEDEEDGGTKREAGSQNRDEHSMMALADQQGTRSQAAANGLVDSDTFLEGELRAWLDEFTKGILQQVVSNLETSGLLAEDDDAALTAADSQLDKTILSSTAATEDEDEPTADGVAEGDSHAMDEGRNDDDSYNRAADGEHFGMAVEEVLRTRSFSSMPSVVTWALRPNQVGSRKKRFSSLPSVVSWLPVDRRGAFTCLPSVVTWIRVPKPNTSSARPASNSNKWNALDDVEEVEIPEDEDEGEPEALPVEDTVQVEPEEEFVESARADLDQSIDEPDPDRLNVVLGECEEIQIENALCVTPPGVELSMDEAALRLQRTCRGMLDRKFFRKYRAKVARQNQPASLRRSQQVASVKSASVKLPMIEPDGYLSKTTMKKLQSRGEPLEFTKVEEKFNQIRTKPHVSFDIQIPGYDSEHWHVGESKSIKWKTVGNIEITKVGLYLYRDGEPVHTIVKAVPNGGKYIFSLPDSFSAGEDSFQILVIAEQPKMPHVHAFTPPFSVRDRKAGMLARVPTAIPKLISTFPTRPGWSWIAGDTHMISWTSEGVVQNVSVDILRHSKLVLRLSGSCLNVGAFQFPMPLDAPFGEGFQIRVRCTTNRAAYCLSYPFSIIDRQVAMAVPRRAPKSSRKKSHGTSASLPDLAQSRLLRPLGPPSLSSSQELHPSGAASWAVSNLPNGRLGAPSLNSTASSSFSLSKSLPNAHGLSAISFDSSAPSMPDHPDFESKPEGDEEGGRRRKKTGGSRGSFRSPYFAARAGSGNGRADDGERPSERSPASSPVDNSVDRWMGSDMERFTERGERALKERVSTGRLMASALSPMEASRRAKPRAKSTAGLGKDRRRWGAGADDALSRTVGGRRSVTRTRIISGAEEFLEMRDRMLEDQMARLRDSFANSDGWDRDPDGGRGSRYVPALLPELLDREGRKTAPPPASELGPGGEQWKQYERARIRDGTPSSAITEYIDRVQERIYNMKADPAR